MLVSKEKTSSSAGLRTMKRHSNLFDNIVHMDNISLAHQKARKGKGHYGEVQEVERHKNKYLLQVQEILQNKTFRTAEYKIKTITDSGKQREIHKLPYFPDRIIHHAIMNIVQPIWDKTFIHDCCSAVPGKGIHFGLRRLRSFLGDMENTRYCLKFDIKKYYPSINHNILMELIERKIKCKNTLNLLEDIVRSPEGSSGVPIGNYLSQYFANIYLDRLDHWLKESRRMRYYIRYSDDGVILHGCKKTLQTLLIAIQEYLLFNLKLELNQKTQLFSVDSRGVDFLGYRSFRHYTLLRKSSAKRFKRKVHKLESLTAYPYHTISSVMSYMGWIKHCNGYNLVNSHILQNDRLLEVMDNASEALGIANPLQRYHEIRGE